MKKGMTYYFILGAIAIGIYLIVKGKSSEEETVNACGCGK